MTYYRVSKSEWERLEKRLAELFREALECASERDALREEVKYLREQNKTLIAQAFPPVVSLKTDTAAQAEKEKE